MQPYNLGNLGPSDEAPDLSSLIQHTISARTSAELQGCAVLVSLMPKEGDGERSFYSPTATTVEIRPQLRLSYDPPTTAAQLGWTSGRTCDVTVAVPTQLLEGDTCISVDGASTRTVTDTSVCPHLSLRAEAATTLDSCGMSANGLDLFTGCGLDRLVVGRDGVCAVLIQSGRVPRATCFDTKAQGAGAEQLASWIDTLPYGATAMVVSCSRLSWRYNRAQLASSLASLGALDPPISTDDAYALVGTKGASRPLSESRTPCCLNPNPVCTTCDQTPAVASSEAACGEQSRAAPSVLSSPVYGAFGSESYVSAVGVVSAVATNALTTLSSGPTSIVDLQTADVDVLDAPCNSALAATDGDRHGALLATDGDSSSYWMSVGTPDAILTVDLGSVRRVARLNFEWVAPARSLLVLYLAAAGTAAGMGTGTGTGTDDGDWRIGASAYRTTISTMNLTDGSAASVLGVSARYLRLYLADPSATAPGNASLPMFALRELHAISCAPPANTITLGTQLTYSAALTPVVTSVSPRRGSTAGGTIVTLTVEGLPVGSTIADVAVSVVGLPCVVTSVASSSVTCTTSSYGVTSSTNPGSGDVSLIHTTLGAAAATGNATYEYVDLWSRRTTWGGEGNAIPGLETRGDSIWIPKGQRILLDVDINVYMVIVQGSLEFDRRDINLDASYIFVVEGSLIVGTEEEPFVQRAVITLHGSPVSQEIPVYGAKTLACRFCTLDLHGRPLLGDRTHTKLAQTAVQGATELWLTEPVDWDTNSQITITSTSADGSMEEFDVAELVGVTDGGYRLQVS